MRTKKDVLIIKKHLSECYLKIIGKFATKETDKIIDEIYRNIELNYSDKSTSNIISAINDGGKGMYGRSMRFCFQDISFWLRDGNKQRL